MRVAIQEPAGETLGVTARADVDGCSAVALLMRELMPFEVMFGFPNGGEPIAAVAIKAHIGRHRLGLWWETCAGTPPS